MDNIAAIEVPLRRGNAKNIYVTNATEFFCRNFWSRFASKTIENLVCGLLNLAVRIGSTTHCQEEHSDC